MAFAACSGSPRRPIERLAILPFENLTGDVSLDWVASAAPTIVASEITGSAKVFPLHLATVNDAYRLGATRFVHGFFTGWGEALHFEIEVEDASTHKIVTATAVDGSVLNAMKAVAERLEPAAHQFSTSNAEAVAAWGRGEYQSAVTRDPDFGMAWLAWAQASAVEGNTARAAEVASRALERPGLRSPVDRARIELALAVLRKDEIGRRNALVALAGLVPADTSSIVALAEIETNARRFTAAAVQYRSLLRLEPGNAAAMNSLGYAEALAGNLEAARKILEEYGRLPEQKTNSLDSRGEAYFMNGRFAEAEQYFIQAYQANPSFLGGADLLKAAYSRWLGGDLPGADSLMKRYLEIRASLRDPLLAWREAVWEYATGRREQALLKLQSASPELVEKQTAAWRGAIQPPRDLSDLKEMYQRTPPSADGEARTFYASALLAAGQKEDARNLLVRWPLPDSAGDPVFQSLVYPKFLELRRAVGL